MTMSIKPSTFVICFTGDSGITHYSISLCQELTKYSDVTLVTSTKYFSQDYPPSTFSVIGLFRRSRWYPVDILRLLFLLFTKRPEHVLVQSTLKVATVESLIIKGLRLCGMRASMTVHDLLPHYPKPWSHLSHLALYQSYERLIVHSDRTLQDARKLGVTRPCLVVPHGTYDVFISRPSRRHEMRQQLGIPADAFVALFFGTVDKRKGISCFLDAAEYLASDSRYHFVIAGKPSLSDHPHLLSKLEAAKTAANCTVVGQSIPFSDVQDYFNLADVIALPYEEGTTSGVLKLALAFRKPVVATDVGDLGETVSTGIGMLLKQGSTAEQLAAAIARIRDNHSSYLRECEAMAVNCGWAKVGQDYWTFLNQEVH